MIHYMMRLILVLGLSALLGPAEGIGSGIRIRQNDFTDLLKKGEIVSFRTSGTHGISYHVYTPEDFDPQLPPPIVIAFSSGGLGKELLQSFIDAAETMGWIGVGCDSLQNNMVVKEAVKEEMEDELLDEILSTIPHNEQRVYLAGNSGGAWRSYGLTVRRSDHFAGVIAHGGWLGGPQYQDLPFQEGMHVAMLNGNQDMGAGAWTVRDTEVLRRRNCTVKHFTCLGGHVVAPADLTLLAFRWLEEQWNIQSECRGSISLLRVLYIGNDEDRTRGFVDFLNEKFYKVKSVHSDSVTLALCNEADILVLDEPVYTLPDNYNKAMMLIGPSALYTAQRFGSKMKQAKEFDAKDGLIIDRGPFLNAGDSEILQEVEAMDGIKGIMKVREGSRLVRCDSTSPANMAPEERELFYADLLWIYQFDGVRQTLYKDQTPRDSIFHIIDRIDLESNSAMRWIPEDALKLCDYNRHKLKKYYRDNLPYIFTDFGSGQLSVDTIARSFHTPNGDPASILKWLDIFENNGWPLRWNSNTLLYRYIGTVSDGAKDRRQWYEKNKDRLWFSDQEGYRFMLSGE